MSAQGGGLLTRSTCSLVWQCVFVDLELPYLFKYNALNFVRNFNQKLRVRIIHELFSSARFIFISFFLFHNLSAAFTHSFRCNAQSLFLSL